MTSNNFISRQCEATSATGPERRSADRRSAWWATSLALAWGLSLVVVGQAVAADWPVVRGNQLATGVSADALPEKPELLWTIQAPSGGFDATAVIVDNVVYVGDFDGTFHAVRLNDGSVVWQEPFGDTGFLSGAAVAAGRIYVGDFNGVVRCLATADGEEIWKIDAESEINAAPNLLEKEGVVLLTTEAGELIALAASDGVEKWRYQIEAPLRCWPTVVDGRVVLAGCDGRAHAVDLSGELIDSIEIDGPTGSTAAAQKGRVYFGTEQGSFYSIRANPLKIDWHYQDPKYAQGIRTAAAVSKQAVVYGSQGKTVFSLNPTSGEPNWTFPVRTRVESSPVIAGDAVFLATSRGRIHAVDLATGKETWQFEAGGGFTASPAVSNGRIVIGNTDGALYCFGKRD